MKPAEDIEPLELLFMEMDPLVDILTGMLLDIHRQGDRYILLEKAPQ